LHVSAFKKYSLPSMLNFTKRMNFSQFLTRTCNKN